MGAQLTRQLSTLLLHLAMAAGTCIHTGALSSCLNLVASHCCCIRSRSQLFEAADKLAQDAEQAAVMSVLHTLLVALLSDNAGDSGVVDEADGWEEVVLNLQSQDTRRCHVV